MLDPMFMESERWCRTVFADWLHRLANEMKRLADSEVDQLTTERLDRLMDEIRPHRPVLLIHRVTADAAAAGIKVGIPVGDAQLADHWKLSRSEGMDREALADDLARIEAGLPEWKKKLTAAADARRPDYETAADRASKTAEFEALASEYRRWIAPQLPGVDDLHVRYDSTGHDYTAEWRRTRDSYWERAAQRQCPVRSLEEVTAHLPLPMRPPRSGRLAILLG